MIYATCMRQLDVRNFGVSSRCYHRCNMLAERIDELKRIIAGNDGKNAADRGFARVVDELVNAVYDDIGEIKDLPTRALFDLFVIKVLYVGRGSRHADVIDYLGELLDTHLYTRALYPVDADGKSRTMYFSDLLDRKTVDENYETPFEAYRTYADNALFLSGVFHRSLKRRRSSSPGMLRRQRTSGVDSEYYVSTGKTMYRMAARHDLAEEPQRETFGRLADCFEIYADALKEMSERYILGFDMRLLSDKMLDNFNRYRESNDEAYLTNARRYAAVLRLDGDWLPASYGV